MKNYLLSLSVVLLMVGCTPKKKADEKTDAENTEITTDNVSEDENENEEMYQSEDEDEKEEISESESITKISATYEGFKDGKFSFSYAEENEKNNLVFETIPKGILSEFDLKSDKFKGQKFKVNYINETNGDDETVTLLSLEKI